MVLHCVSHLIIIIIIINVLFSFFFYFSKYILSYRNLESDLLFILPKQNPLHKKRKKITRQNQNLNNENYHRLNHIVKKPFCPVQLDSNALLFPKKYTHTPIFRIGIFLAAPLVFHRVFPCTQQWRNKIIDERAINAVEYVTGRRRYTVFSILPVPSPANVCSLRATSFVKAMPDFSPSPWKPR